VQFPSRFEGRIRITAGPYSSSAGASDLPRGRFEFARPPS